MAYNKIIYAGKTLIDLTEDTVDVDHLLTGITAHSRSGEILTGECSFDSDTSDATALATEVLNGKTVYARGEKVTGTMVNNGACNLEIYYKDHAPSIPIGYHDGSGKAGIAADEKLKLIPANIKQGVELLGIVGASRPVEDLTIQTKTVTPESTKKLVVPDEGYDYLSQVTVSAIPYSEILNDAGGITVKIG